MSDLQTELKHFQGSATFTRYPLGGLLLTEGVVHLAKRAGAFWLLDAIGSYQHLIEVKREDFQAWKLVVTDNSAHLGMTDGNTKREIVGQDIEYTDFPLPEITLWLEGDPGSRVLMLPSER